MIKDRFAPQKEMSAAHVRACYQLVKEHDRVGRMADTQEFENFVLEKRQISAELMALLPVSYTHLTLPTKDTRCRSRWSPYH